MRKLGTIDLEILHLAINKDDTFDETDLEKSELRRLGVGRILDSLATLKDRKMLSLNRDGSFTITEFAREILWSKKMPTWAKILQLLQIKSCSIKQISDILKISADKLDADLEKLRQSQFVLMSPQRQDEKVVKMFEILPEGIKELDRTEARGFDKTKLGEAEPEKEILSTIDEVIADIQGTEITQAKKGQITKKLSSLKERLEI